MEFSCNIVSITRLQYYDKLYTIIILDVISYLFFSGYQRSKEIKGKQRGFLQPLLKIERQRKINGGKNRRYLSFLNLSKAGKLCSLGIEF